MGVSLLRRGEGKEHTQCSLATQHLFQPLRHAIILHLAMAWYHGSLRILEEGLRPAPTQSRQRHHGPEIHTYGCTREPGKGLTALRRGSRDRRHALGMGARAWHGGRDPMISEVAGAGVIRQDVQEAIEREVQYRLREGDAPGALARWQKELLLLVIQTVKANACL